MNRWVILGVVVALPVMLAVTSLPASPVFDGCIRFPELGDSSESEIVAKTILVGGDRVGGPTSSTGIPIDTRTVFVGCDRIAGPTSSTGMPILPALSALPTGFR